MRGTAVHNRTVVDSKGRVAADRDFSPAHESSQRARSPATNQASHGGDGHPEEELTAYTVASLS